MKISDMLKIYLLKEQSAFLKLVGKNLDDVLKNLENLGTEGKFLRKSLKDLSNYLSNLEPQEIAALKKSGVNIADVVNRAEKATASEADDVAREINSIVKGTKAEKVLSPEQAFLKQLDVAADLEKRGQKTAAEQIRRSAAQKYGFPLDEQLKGIDDYLKEIDLAKKAGLPSRAAKLEAEMVSKYGSSWEKLKLWVKQNPGKITLLGLGAATLAYFAVSKETSPAPKPAVSTGGGGSGGSGGGKKKKCDDNLLKSGCKGDNVKDLQKKLITCGYALPKYGADGSFGAETKSAIIKFQKDNNLKANGIADEETIKILKMCNKKEDIPVEKTPIAEPETTPAEKGEPVPGLPGLKKIDSGDESYYVSPSGATLEVPVDERGKPLQENKNYLLRTRNEQVEKLVFERLVKGCK
jgi:peptidoglycan hydrolase-like protein with peptidoglycan-binding domain